MSLQGEAGRVTASSPRPVRVVARTGWPRTVRPRRARTCHGNGVLQVPQVVRNRAITLGPTVWLQALPGLGADLSREWSVVVGRVFADATEAFVAEATLDDGTAAVIKVQVPGRLNLVPPMRLVWCARRKVRMPLRAGKIGLV